MTAPGTLTSQLANVIARQLAVAVEIEPLDTRFFLLDTIRELFDRMRPLLDSADFRTVRLVRELADMHRTLSVECEGELRKRAMARSNGKP